MSLGVIQVDGNDIECLDLAGDPELPVLLMLHEGLGSVALWRDVPWQLQAALGCRVVAYGRRGYGQSTPYSKARPVRHLSVMHEEAQLFLPKLLTQLAIDHYYLLGHSDGASIAFIHAASFPDNSVIGMSLIAPHLFCESICVAAITEAKQRFEETDWPQKMAKYHRDPHATFYAWADVWLHPRFREWDLRGYLPMLCAPTLAIQGDADPYGTTEQVAGFLEQLILPNGAHSPHLEKSQCARTVNAIIAHYKRCQSKFKG